MKKSKVTAIILSIYAIMVLFILTFSLASCSTEDSVQTGAATESSNSSSSSSSGSASSGTSTGSESSSSADEVADSIILSVTLPGTATRSVYYTEDEVSSYKITASLADSTYSVSAEGTAGSTVTLTLTEEGSYTFVIKGYDDEETEIASGTKTQTLAFSKETQTLEITVNGYEKTIDVSITVGWNADESVYYLPGQYVTIDEVEYVVIANHLNSVMSSRSADDASDTSNPYIIETYASDSYIRKVLANYDVTNYIVLWKPSDDPWTKKDNPAKTEFHRTFYIANQDGGLLFKYTEMIQKTDLMKYLLSIGSSYATGLTTSSTNAQYGTAFLQIPEAELWTVYNPNRFRFESRSLYYGSDTDKMINTDTTYLYDENGEVALTESNKTATKTRYDYQLVNDAYRYSYVMQERFNNTDYDRIDYAIARNIGGEFYSFSSRDYPSVDKRVFYVERNGNGTLDQETIDGDVEKFILTLTCASNNTGPYIEIKAKSQCKNEGTSSEIKAKAYFGASLKDFFSQEVDVYHYENDEYHSSESMTLLAALSDASYFKDYFYIDDVYSGNKTIVTIAEDETETQNTYVIPASIKMKITSGEEDVDFTGEYMVVDFVPDLTEDYITYKAVTDTLRGKTVPSFVKKYSDDFATAGSNDTAYSFPDYTIDITAE